LNDPTAVRAAETITISVVMCRSPFEIIYNPALG